MPRQTIPFSPLFLLVLGIATALIGIEAGLRVYWWPDGPDRAWDTSARVADMRWIPHPFQPFAGGPNATFTLKNDGVYEHITTNSYGFRAHEFPAEKQPADYFVLTFGGSTTYGYKVDVNANTWPERLEALLTARYPDRNVRVFNLGVDMATSAVSLVNLALIGVHVQPDLVIVYHGWNDMDALGNENFRTDHAHMYRDLDVAWATAGYQARLPRWMRRSHLLTMATAALDRVRGTKDLSLAAQLPRQRSGDRLHGIATTLRNFESMRAVAASAGAHTLFATFQFRDAPNEPALRAFNDTLRVFFAERGYDYVDQDALLPDLDPTINVDPCHFTQKGRDLMAQHFFEHIVSQEFVQPQPTTVHE